MARDYSHMTPEQLLEANKPYLTKIQNRERLTDEEEDEHYAIMDEARKQMDARRKKELEDRAKTHGATEAPHVPLWFKEFGK